MKYHIGDEEYETLEEYVEAIDYEHFCDSNFAPEGLILEEQTVVDSYVDYKRGYETTLYILSEDYKYSGKTKPLEKDKKYFGVEMTHNNWGTVEYSGLSRYELKKKRITVKEWLPKIIDKNT